MDDGPRGLRALERAYRGTRDSNDGLALACAQGRVGDRDAAFRTLSDLIVDDGRDAGTHEQAIVAFRALLGDCYVDGSDPRYPGRWVLGYVAPGLPGSLPDAHRFIVEDLDKDLLDGGRRHSQAEHRVFAEQRGRQLQGRPWSLQGLPDYMDQAIALYGACDHPLVADRVEAVRGALESGMKEYQVFDSQTVWTPGTALDRFYPHGVGAQGTELALAGPHGYLRDLQGLEGVSRALFGTSDVGSVRETLKWIGGREPYMWRFDETQKTNITAEVERVVGLVVSDYYVGIYLGGYVGGVARGWLRRCTRNFLERDPSAGQ